MDHTLLEAVRTRDYWYVLSVLVPPYPVQARRKGLLRVHACLHSARRGGPERHCALRPEPRGRIVLTWLHSALRGVW